MATRKIGLIEALSLLTIKLLYNTGANCFIVNDPSYLHNFVPSTDTVDVTEGSSAQVDYKGILYLYLVPIDKISDIAILIQIRDVPCIKSNLHSGLPLTPFADYGFK